MTVEIKRYLKNCLKTESECVLLLASLVKNANVAAQSIRFRTIKNYSNVEVPLYLNNNTGDSPTPIVHMLLVNAFSKFYADLEKRYGVEQARKFGDTPFFDYSMFSVFTYKEIRRGNYALAMYRLDDLITIEKSLQQDQVRVVPQLQQLFKENQAECLAAIEFEWECERMIFIKLSSHLRRIGTQSGTFEIVRDLYLNHLNQFNFEPRIVAATPVLKKILHQGRDAVLKVASRLRFTSKTQSIQLT